MRHQIINPEIRREAELRYDCPITDEILADVAAGMRKPLFVELQRHTLVPVQRRALDVSALSTLSRGEDFAQRERERQVREGAFRLLRLNCRLAARRYADAREAAHG